ncbi:MAG TPA: hypothetical protein ENJ82_05770, partial [Bacteroidetes bacterium]|nr:hypothetical protein [Bacteroidota bacterium]
MKRSKRTYLWGMEKRFRIHPQLLPWLMGGGIVLLNLLLKLWQAGETSLYLDEGASIFYAQMDGDAFAAFLNQDASPPLYYWLLHGWMAIVGDDLGVLRGLSGAISSLAAIGIFALGKRFFSNYAGLLAALLFTFSNLHFQYAQEVRCYALLGMLSVWSMYFLLGMVRDRRWSDFLGLMLVNLGILGTHYAGFALLLAQGLIMLAILPFDFKRVLRYALSQMPLLALALILILKDVNADKLGATSWLTAPKAPMLLKILSPFSGNSFMALAIICVFAIGMGALLWQWRQGETAAGKKLRLFLVLLAWPLLGLLVAWLISQWMPFFIAKYLAHIGIGWLVAAAIAVGQLPFRRWGKWAVGLFLLCGTLFL